jgi:hypothetical protein
LVNVTKWIVIGLGILAASFFFKEAAASSLTGTLHRTGLAGQSLGTGIAATGAGVGEAGVRLLDPFFSLGDLFSKFGNLFNGGSTKAGETLTSTTQPAIDTTGGVSAGLPNVQLPKDWFNPLPAANAVRDIHVGSLTPSEANLLGIDAHTRGQGTAPYSIFGQVHQLTPPAVQYYQNLGVEITGGGINPTSGGGGGIVGSNSPSSSSTYAGGSIPASVGQTVSWGG